MVSDRIGYAHHVTVWHILAFGDPLPSTRSFLMLEMVGVSCFNRVIDEIDAFNILYIFFPHQSCLAKLTQSSTWPFFYLLLLSSLLKGRGVLPGLGCIPPLDHPSPSASQGPLHSSFSHSSCISASPICWSSSLHKNTPKCLPFYTNQPSNPQSRQ